MSMPVHRPDPPFPLDLWSPKTVSTNPNLLWKKKSFFLHSEFDFQILILHMKTPLCFSRFMCSMISDALAINEFSKEKIKLKMQS